MEKMRTAMLGAALALATLAACTPPPISPAPAPDDSPRIIGYVASWGVRSKGTRIAELPGARLTHINYAFANLSPDGRIILGNRCLDIGECGPGDSAATPGGNFAALRQLKARYPHLRVLISVGGWSWSKYFSDAAATPEAREAFARSGIELMRASPGVFDGIDIDWEFPVSGGMAGNIYRPEDRGNFTLLLAEMRRQLDAEALREGRRYLLTIATSALPRALGNLEPERIMQYVDFINVMTYDYHTGGPIAHFNAPLYASVGDPTPGLSVDSTVRAYLAAGVPASRLVVGVPFFGKSYGSVPPENNGRFQPSGGPAPREWAQGLDYRTLKTRRPEENGFVRFWDDQAKVPWLYSPSMQTWITYDDSVSIALKTDYVAERKLGGIMIWELGGDDGTLLATIDARLRRAVSSFAPRPGTPAPRAAALHRRVSPTTARDTARR